MFEELYMSQEKCQINDLPGWGRERKTHAFDQFFLTSSRISRYDSMKLR